jgi:anaerobic magnesium-protoporphyrin IX monomethyl ester cyclase
MVDIVLVRCRNLTEEEGGDAGKFGGQSYPCLGVLYIQTYLRKHGFHAIVLDRYDDKYIDLDTKTFVEEIHKLNPRFIGLSAITCQVQDTENISRVSRSKYPDIPIIVGGVHYGSLPEEGIKVADYVVIGDGEHATLDILQGTANLGIIQGKSIDPDDVPFPTVQDFSNVGYNPEEIGKFSLITARGCPFECYFCKDGFRGSAVRHHSVEYVGNMVEFVLKNYAIDKIFILDDIFIPNEERLREYLKEFKKRGLKVRLEVFFHPNTVRKKLLPLFWDLGVRKVSLGIESGSEKILGEMGKHVSKNTIMENARLLHSYGFEVSGLFIIGHRGETGKTMHETLDFARELSLSSAWFSYMVPFPGTPVWNEGIDQFGEIVHEDMSDWGNMIPVFLPRELTLEQITQGMEESKKIKKEIRKRWRNKVQRLKRKINYQWNYKIKTSIFTGKPASKVAS